MCGIHVAINRDKVAGALPASLYSCLCSRGPDHFGQVTVSLAAATAVNAGAFLTFTSTVLSLRGDHVTPQPFQDRQTGSVLCWNGEAWKIDGRAVQGNDGKAVFALLFDASARSSGAGANEAVLDAVRSIEGPFAFVYFDARSNVLYFGRDRLGRRSLTIAHNETEGSFVLSSIAEISHEKWKEVEADGIYSVALHGDLFSSPYVPPTRHDWVPDTGAEYVSSIGVFNTTLPTEHVPLISTSPSVSQLKEQLAASLSLRVLNIPEPPGGPDTRVAVLFSGGLDCTVLARMGHDLLPPEQAIDLLNVAFENPRVAAQLQKQAKGAKVDVYEACPDRITGRKAFAELQSVCAGRVFRFVAVDVPYTEMCAHRSQIVSLIYPHNTEMDLSIACALYFAARGQGTCYSSSDPHVPTPTYTTPARVLLSGLGADELFGGYVRHPSAFERAGYPGLIDELKLDVGRLGKRNLGRDDRAMAHWGREVRFPFLDERLVKRAVETPAWEKCDFEHGEEVSGVEAGKRVLRLVAMGLGMEGVAREKKRAIQFGSRTAKMESGRVKGTMLIS